MIDFLQACLSSCML